MGSTGLIITLVFSIMINVFIIGFFAVTRMGGDAWTRWRNKQKYKKGGYVYSLLMGKDGNLNEVFTKVNDGKFKYANAPYVRNPRLLSQFKGLPCYLHREDDPAPVNIWGSDFDSINFSCAEMDLVMNNQLQFDFKEWFQKYMPFILMGIFGLVGVIGILAYLDYTTYQMLKDGTFKAVEIMASSSIPNNINVTG